ncbi:hypothetical protein [Nocardioides terrigena]|uniref:hypothetical protein n=1 Tax=Nocardioides terrigena TaxID=424797 RepID=UPI00131EFA9F|nr:hypothetical protein [Nocardioides terrigena]
MRLSSPLPVRLETIDPWHAYVAPLAAAAGLRHDPRAEVVLHVTDLPDDCCRADPWVVDSRPHLTVAAVPDAVRVGPFVVPGLTACLRCVRAWRDGPTPSDRPVATPLAAGPGVDAGLLALALGWAARDVATWVGGGTPSTWSSTVTVGTDLRPDARSWQRHPHCGCSWGEAV